MLHQYGIPICLAAVNHPLTVNFMIYGRIIDVLYFFLAYTMQGHFPDENTEEDGHTGVAPVDAFPAQNKFGNIT